MEIGKNIKQNRLNYGKSQKEIAIKTGISQQAQNTWETSKKYPTIEKLVILADFYGISIDSLRLFASY